MTVISRGFHGRRSARRDLPPGQYEVHDFPVLSAGPKPRVAREDWEFTLTTVAGTTPRSAPEGSPRPPGRLTAEEVSAYGCPAEFAPMCFLSGPTGFVERAAAFLVAQGHDPSRIWTERFGPVGG